MRSAGGFPKAGSTRHCLLLLLGHRFSLNTHVPMLYGKHTHWVSVAAVSEFQRASLFAAVNGRMHSRPHQAFGCAPEVSKHSFVTEYQQAECFHSV